MRNLIFFILSWMCVVSAGAQELSLGAAKAISVALPIFEKSAELPINRYFVKTEEIDSGYRLYFYIKPNENEVVRGGDATIIVDGKFRIISKKFGR